MQVVVGVVLLVLGAAGASATVRRLSTRMHGPRLALAVAPAGILIGAGAALVRDWDPVPSAVMGAVLVAALAFTTGLKFERRSSGRRS